MKIKTKKLLLITAFLYNIKNIKADSMFVSFGGSIGYNFNLYTIKNNENNLENNLWNSEKIAILPSALELYIQSGYGIDVDFEEKFIILGSLGFMTKKYYKEYYMYNIDIGAALQWNFLTLDKIGLFTRTGFNFLIPDSKHLIKSNFGIEIAFGIEVLDNYAIGIKARLNLRNQLDDDFHIESGNNEVIISIFFDYLNRFFGCPA